MNSNTISNSHFNLALKIAFGYFFVIALLGTILRFFPLADFSFTYKHLLHAHSHVALLGWVYTALTTAIYYLFLKDKPISKTYLRLFWFTQISIIGMLFTFPVTGYALFSIIFSTLFLIGSYGFFWIFSKHTSQQEKQTFSYKLIKTSLWFLVVSSLGPWALGYIMTTLGNTSAWYRNAIYFFLHFQYNGWFIVALFGLLFKVFENHAIYFTKRFYTLFYNFFIVGVILTFLLSVLWMKLPSIYNSLAFFGGLAQGYAVVLLVIALRKQKTRITNHLSSFTLLSLKIVFVLFAIKLVLQIIGTIPSVAIEVSGNKELIIGYLHWVFLGVISISILGFLNHLKLINLSKQSLVFYVIAFLFTETILFIKGIETWWNLSFFSSYLWVIALATILLLLSITILLLQVIKK